MPRFSGGCACGAIRYETESEPLTMFNCHCRDCQRSTGAGFAPIIVFRKSAVRLVGEARTFRTVGASGSWVDRGFCAQCGSPVLFRLERLPDLLAIYAASLDDPSTFKPASDIFAASAQPWDHMDPTLRKFAQGMTRQAT